MYIPLVSVCMITYNHERYIGEAIEGVLMQVVDFDMELIIADDCSTDRSNEIVQSYIEFHPKGHLIRYIKHAKNKGMMTNFVWAINSCKGEFIALCEGDDYWTSPNKLKTQVDFLVSNQRYSMTFHDSNFLTREIQRKFSEKYTFLNDKSVYRCEDLLIRKWFIPTASMVFRNFTPPEWLLKVNAGDFSLQLILSQYGDLYFFPYSWSIYRIHSEGQSQVLNTHGNRLNDIRLWWIHVPNINRLTLCRWYFSNWWRLKLKRLLRSNG